MEKFELLKGIAAPLPMMNVDTDMIIPKQFLKTIKRSGLGKNLFHELRFDMQGNIKNDFVLNWDPYKEASINFDLHFFTLILNILRVLFYKKEL